MLTTLLISALATLDGSHAHAAVTCDVGWVGPGQTCHVVVSLDIDEDWHVYWVNPGASGAATRVEIDAPDGWTVGEPRYPRPRTFSGPEGVTFGYVQQAAIFVPLTAPAELSEGRAQIAIDVDWLACRRLCVMGREQMTLEICTRGDGEGPPRRDPCMERWRGMLPAPLASLEGAVASVSGDQLHILAPDGGDSMGFLPIDRPGVRFRAMQQVAMGGWVEIRVPLDLVPENARGQQMVIEGLLIRGCESEDPCWTIRIPVEEAATDVSPETEGA